MRATILIRLCFVLLAGALLAPASSASPPGDIRCETLVRMTLPDVTVTSAVAQAAGAFAPAGGPALSDLPAFCRVSAVARPTADSEIHFEMWIPAGGKWNGKFLGVGNDAFLGALNYRLMGDALRRGYATASTDTGHKGGELGFARGHPEKIADWAWRSIHLVAENAKLILRAATGRLPERSYFNGCNTGGHQALMEAQRFPEDYDGIVAGAPAAARVHEIIGYLGIWKATRGLDGKDLLTHADLRHVTAAATRLCDAQDGLADGVIANPQACRFDPETLLCKPGQASDCLSRAQVEAVRAVYRGIRDPRTGAMVFAGWPVGSEGYGPTERDGWSSLVTGNGPRRGEFFANFVFDDPNWDWRSFDFDRDVAYSDAKMGFISAVDPDLRAFRARGGKLLIYGGWVDPILPAAEVIDYYEQVQQTMGSRAAADFSRFYMLPGYGHCNGGPGEVDFDMVAALEKWVETGRIEDPLAHGKRPDGSSFSRPICTYPRTLRYKGRGDPDAATSFECAPAR